MSFRSSHKNKADSKTYQSKDYWKRPSDWLSLPSVSSTEQKIVILKAIFNGSGNFTAFTITGGFTVDWGDGIVQTFTAGTTAYHTYDYNNAAFNTTFCSRGYKQAIITITAQSGETITNVNFNVLHNQSGLTSGYESGFLDIIISLSGCLVLTFETTVILKHLLERVKILSLNAISLANCFKNCRLLQSVELHNLFGVDTIANMFENCYSLKELHYINTGSITTMAGTFLNCKSLKKVPLFNTVSVTNMANAFSGCLSLESVPLFNTINVANMSNMFSGCVSLTNIPAFYTPVLTNISGMFSGCSSLETVPFFNTASVTNMSSVFLNCISLKSVPSFNTGSVTTMANMFDGCNSLSTVPYFNLANVTTLNSMFANCKSLSTVPAFNINGNATLTNMFNSCTSLSRIEAVGFKQTFSVANCQLSSTELNNLYTNLAVTSGAKKTITVTGNYGVSGDNPSIATAKDWTVTG